MLMLETAAYTFCRTFGVFQGLLDRLLFKVQLQRDAVAVGKDLIPLLGQQADERRGIRPLGDGGSYITPVVKDGQPGTHAVRYLLMNRVLTLWFSSLSMTS